MAKKIYKVSLLLIVLLFVLMGIYFYNVSFNYELSDIAPHLEGAIDMKSFLEVYSITPQRTIHVSYPLYHILVNILGFICFKNYALASSILLCGSILATYLIMLKMTNDLGIEINYKTLWIMFLLNLMICFPFNGKLYLPQGSPNVWHNPTFLVMKPFALLSFYSFCMFIKNRKNNYLLIFMISCFLSVIAKPSFTIVFLPIAGIVTLVILFKDFKANFIFSLKLLLAVLPTLIILIIQYVITLDVDSGIVIRIGGFQNLSYFSMIAATISALFYPIMFLVLNRNRINFKFELLLSYLIYAFAWIQYFILDEAQYNHGNFAWGYYTALFVLYFITTLNLIKINEKKNIIIYAILAIQIIFGLIYFINIFMMKGYLL